MSEVRLAGPGDAETIASLLCAFRDWFGSTTPADETFRSTVTVLLEDPRTEYLLAGDVGFAQLRYRLSAWTGVEDCWLEDLFVHASARGTGVGRALVEACLARARERGCRRVELDVQETNAAAIALYERSGFTQTPKGSDRTLFLSRRLE